MNTATLARSAYATARAPIRTDRSTEYDVFARITRNMKEASDRGKPGFPALVSALHENRKLWTILATDVAGQHNELPRQLRAQIFYLAKFTEAHSRKVMAGQSDISPLLEINTSIMRGLRATSGVPA